MEKSSMFVARRDTGEKSEMSIENAGEELSRVLFEIQNNLTQKTRVNRESRTVKVDTRDEFTKALNEGKFVLAHRDGTGETEDEIKNKCKATIRCLPYDDEGNDLYKEEGKCILT